MTFSMAAPDDRLKGGDGNDLLFGGVGSDTVHGGNGDDTVYHAVADHLGSGAADVYHGGAGHDTLVVDLTGVSYPVAEAMMIPISEAFATCHGATDCDPLELDGFGVIFQGFENIDFLMPNQPPVAMHDVYTVNENATLSVASPGVLANDADPEGDTLSVVEINGNPASVGLQVILPSNTPLQVNASGSFTYDPNGQFDHLDAGEVATDTFSYMVSDGAGGTDTATVTVTITGVDDPPMMFINDVVVSEAPGEIALFTVALSHPSAMTTTVDYVTSDGSATAGDDYAVTSGTLTFLPGETAQDVLVTVIDDPIHEGDETFSVFLSNPSNATIIDDQGLGTIIDNDFPPPAISIDDVVVSEAPGGIALFTVALSHPSTMTTTVDYVTSDGSATAGDDYAVTSGTLTFLPGETAQNVSVAVNDDVFLEADETFSVFLSNPSNATIIDDEGLGTIIDFFVI